MIKLGLIGANISHSRSQEMYENLLGTQVDYHLLDYALADEVPSLNELFIQGFLGISITFPYKKLFLENIQIEEKKIRELNAVNCIRLNGHQFEATNTDYLAAKYLLGTEFSSFDSFVILGSGNMAKIFSSLLVESGHSFLSLARSEVGDLNNYNYIGSITGTPSKTLLINCCSRAFEFMAELPEGVCFWDMNYSFQGHEHLKLRNITYRDGLNLLHWQAKFALEFWKFNLNRNS